MTHQPGGWLSRLSHFLVPPSQPGDLSAPPFVTNKRILDELIACFEDSIHRESVGESLLFNAHFLIILHPDLYEERLNALPVVVDEAVTAFTTRISALKGSYRRVMPVASGWFFKFGAGREFDGEDITPDTIKVIGALTGLLPETAQPVPASASVNVTRRVKLTNRYEKGDIGLNTFQAIDFREPGAFVVRFPPAWLTGTTVATPAPFPVVTAKSPSALPGSGDTALAQIGYYLAETNEENVYLMHDREIVIARKEPENEHFPNYLLIPSGYVSNPHARIRFHAPVHAFQLASFSRNETRINEQLVPRSEPANPTWCDLPGRAQILLNSLVTLTFQSNL